MNNQENIESMPLRYKLLFDGDLRGWRTGIDCVLELSTMDRWKKHTINDDDRAILTEVKNNQGRDNKGNYVDYQWIVDDFIDDARATLEGVEYRLEWIDGSIFAVPVDINEHERIRLYEGE